MTGAVIVLTGPPGAGKSTVSRLLADAAEFGVHLHSDDFWRFIRSGVVVPYLPEAQEQNVVVMDVLAGAAFRYAAGGYLVLCDGIFGPWFLGAFRDAQRAAAVPLHYVVLRPDEETTVARAVARDPGGGETLTDPGPVRALYAQLASLGDLEPHVLDTSALDAAATADAVRAGVGAGRFRLEVSHRSQAGPVGTAG